MTEIETQSRENPQLRDVRVAILTGYLHESLEDMFVNAPNPGWAFSQIAQFGYNPVDSLSGIKVITTPKFRVELTNPKGTDRNSHSYENSFFYETLLDPKAILAIAGSAKDIEESIREYKNAGLIVARYSIFYGNPSNYTGRSAAESGYALDIPKDVSTVKRMLTCDPLLESLAQRDEKAIKESLRVLNQNLERPVLITPFLHETLQNQRSRGYQQ